MNYIKICFLCICLFTTNETNARNISIILSDGRIVELNTEAPDHAKITRDLFQAQRLALKEKMRANLVYAVSVDHATSRIYISLISDYESRGTYVLDLKTLNSLGFMPGITEIIIPITTSGKTIVGKKLILEHPALDNWTDLSEWNSEYVIFDRNNFRKKLLNKNIYTTVISLNCLTPDGGSFVGESGSYPIAEGVNYWPKIKEKDRLKVMRDQGLIQTCWPDGSLVTFGGILGKQDRAFVALLSPLKKFISKIPINLNQPLGIPIGPSYFWTLGLHARFAVGSSNCYDFIKGLAKRCGIRRPNYFSQDRMRGYRVDNSYLKEDIPGENRDEYQEGIDLTSIESGELTSGTLNLGPLEKSIRTDINFLKESILYGPELCAEQLPMQSEAENVTQDDDQAMAAHSRYGPQPLEYICKDEAKLRLDQYSQQNLEFVESLGSLHIGLAGVFEN